MHHFFYAPFHAPDFNSMHHNSKNIFIIVNYAAFYAAKLEFMLHANFVVRKLINHEHEKYAATYAAKLNFMSHNFQLPYILLICLYLPHKLVLTLKGL